MTKPDEKETDYAKEGDIVSVHFTCKLEDGTVFDSSEGRDPLQFTIGQGEVMPGLEEAVTGMQAGEKKTALITAENAFGPHLAEKVHVVNKDQFPETVKPEVGMKFSIKQEDGVDLEIRITDVSETTVTLDSNHPLAGKNFLFEIEATEVKRSPQALAEEFYKTGVELQDKGQIDEAISCYQKAIEQNKNLTGAFYNLGVAFQEKGELDKAIVYYEIAIGLNQDLADAHHNLGVALKEKGHYDEALLCLQRTIQLKPENAGAYYSIGNTLLSLGRFDDAMAYFRKAVELDPNHADSHWSISLLDLMAGRFEEGWKGYEHRWDLKGVMSRRDFAKPLWDGSDISGRTVLLYAEQGFGDTIQFIRYVPLVASRGAKVVLECQPELAQLAESVEGVQTVVPFGDDLPFFEIHSPLLSLPMLFNTTEKTIPAAIPYLSADSSTAKKWNGKMASRDRRFRIGIAWAGDPKFKFGHDRSMSLALFFPLAAIPETVFYSLQKGAAAAQIDTAPGEMEIVNHMPEANDFSDTAAIIENLDLVISIDTAVAHLAGALGKPVWILLPFVADWRWMLNREASPWYPTARLFRQTSRGDWQTVMERVQKALEEFVQRKKDGHS